MPRDPAKAVEPTCGESWRQRAAEADRQLKLRHFQRAVQEAERFCQGVNDRCIL